MATLKEQQKILQEIAEIESRIEKGTKIQQTTRERYNGLLKESAKITKNITDASKIELNINKDLKNIQKQISDGSKDIYKNLLKGNVQGALETLHKKSTLTQTEKLKKLQGGFAKQLNAQVQSGKIEHSDRLQLLKTQGDLSSGLLNEADIKSEILGLSDTANQNGTDYSKILEKTAQSHEEEVDAQEQSGIALSKNLTKLGIMGVVLGFIVKAVTGFSEKIDSVGKTFGYLTTAAPDFRNSLIDSGNEAIMIGKGLEDVLAVTSQLSSEFGITLKESKDIAGSVLDTATAVGISNDEATKLFGTFMQIGGLTSDQAENLIESTAQLAAQKGVAPAAVLQDMAASSEEIAGFTKDGGNNIAEAAVQARQMGLSLSTTAKIAEGLLDFESSIANEVEASVMIGKQLNFQKARELALDNDIAGATKSIVDQLGSEAEFNKLNIIQRQSLAKSIGVSVSEMAKLVKGSKELTLSGALAGKSFDDLVGQDALSGLTSIINSIKMIGASLMDELGKPIADMLKSFQKSVMTPEGMKNFKNDIIGFINGLSTFLNILILTADIMTLGLSRLFVKGGLGNLYLGSIDQVNDFKSSPGGITHMSGPAGAFSLNPRDSVLATTNPIPVNDFKSAPAGAMNPTTNTNVNVTMGAKISGRDIIFFQENGAEFGDAPGNGLM